MAANKFASSLLVSCYGRLRERLEPRAPWEQPASNQVMQEYMHFRMTAPVLLKSYFLISINVHSERMTKIAWVVGAALISTTFRLALPSLLL